MLHIFCIYLWGKASTISHSSREVFYKTFTRLELSNGISSLFCLRSHEEPQTLYVQLCVLHCIGKHGNLGFAHVLPSWHKAQQTEVSMLIISHLCDRFFFNLPCHLFCWNPPPKLSCYENPILRGKVTLMPYSSQRNIFRICGRDIFIMFTDCFKNRC